MNPLTKYRKAKGLTQYELADATLCSQPRISSIERGKGKPNPKEAHALVAYFGVKVERLFPAGVREKNDYGRRGDWDAHVPYVPDDPPPAFPVRPYPREFWAICKKCGKHLHFRTDDLHVSSDAETECPSCAMPIRDILPLGEMTI